MKPSYGQTNKESSHGASKQKFLFFIVELVVSICLVIVLWVMVKSYTPPTTGGTEQNINFFQTFMRAWSTYHSIDPGILINEIEEEFSITFPQEISNAQAGKGFRDHWQSDAQYPFIIKFELPSIGYLFSIGPMSSLQDYQESLDWRQSGGYVCPDWFLAPITEGKIFDIYVYRKKFSARFHIKVYVDTSNVDKVIVYMSGGLGV
jgi:hypothetical protein